MVQLKDLISKGVLVSPEVLERGVPDDILKKIIDEYGDDLLVIDEDLVNKFLPSSVSSPPSPQSSSSSSSGSVRVVWSYDKPSSKRSYDDFVKNLNMRFDNIAKILRTRQEMGSVVSINRLRSKNDRESVSLIAMIQDKQETANGNIILTLEDKTGTIKALISKSKDNLYSLGVDLQLDEVIGVTGTVSGGEIVFVDNIVFPDIPLTKEFKKSPKEEYLVCVGDPHFGSKVFLRKEFENFLRWINGEVGSPEQREVAKKVKYVIITGDLVEGVGIYPKQELDLAIPNIKGQYDECASYLKRIPSYINIILFPGNHDAGRLSEPQEPLLRKYAESLYALPNVTIVSNPAMVNIGATDQFPGFDVLLYHGGSFIYYSDHIKSIRAAGGQKRVDLVMKYLLQRRHLAPTHEAALTVPTTDRDYLFIDRVPDFFVTGHIHRVSVANYRNVTLINASCWTDTTEDQIKRGLEPQPARLVVVNLHTREAKIMNFKIGGDAPVSRGSDKSRSEG